MTRGAARSDAGLVVGLALMALALRIACLPQSLFGDELFLYAIVHERSLGQVFSTVIDTEKTPPLYFVLGWLFARGSHPEVMLRVPSLVAGVATVPLVYALGARTLGRSAGIVAAAWFAISPFEIFYATEGRSYALTTALVAGSTLALLEALEGGRRRWWALYVLAATAAIYSHYIAGLALLPQVLWALWAHRRRLRQILIANGLVGALYVPWLPSFRIQAEHSAFEAAVLAAVAPLTPARLGSISLRALVGHPYVSVRELLGTGSLLLLALLVAGLGGALVARFIRQPPLRRRPPSAPVVLMALLAVAPVILISLYSLRPQVSFMLPRNVSVAVPYALVLLGALLTSPAPRWALAASLAALLAVGSGTLKMLTPDYRRPDANAVARALDARASRDAVVIEVGFAAFKDPPARAVRLRLRRPHRVSSVRDRERAWATADAQRVPVFVLHYSQSRLPEVINGFRRQDPALFSPPPTQRGRFRLVGEHVSPGLIPIVLREYRPA